MRRRHAAFNPGQFTAIRLALKYIDRRASQMPGAQDCRQFLRIGNSSPIHFDRVHPEPTLVKYHLVLSPKQPLTSGQRPLLFGVRRDLMRVIGENCTLPTIRIWHTTPLTAPICACIQPTHAPPLVPSPQRRITTPMFGRTPVADRLCIDTRNVHQPIMPGFRSQVCGLVKLKFRDCRKHRFQSSQPLRKLHLQRR